jgi:pyruvate/2-oxoglutarate dehydrogenase complex dihydrolipoamide acyltransferase (E2) component
MPLFGRHDGDLVRDEGPVRLIMPYLMRGRNESAVYQQSIYRVTAARAWLRAYNRAHRHQPATLFHLVAYGCAVALHEKPRLNRFVAGHRIWQRRGVSISFVAKTEMTESAPDTTVKLEAPRGESFPDFSRQLVERVEGARGGGRKVDQEAALIMRLPGPVVRLLVDLARWLDHWHLFPRFMTEEDPMYASLFLANLGSVGVSHAWHHLFEYGTCSIFGAVSAVHRHPFADRDGVVSAEALDVRWTFDERIDDAFSAARALAIVQQVVEDPATHLGDPTGAPTWRRPA